MDQRFRLSIPNYEPDSVAAHSANLKELDRWANTLPFVHLNAWEDVITVVKFGGTVATIVQSSRVCRMGNRVDLAIAFRLVNLNGGVGAITISLPYLPYVPVAPTQSYNKPLGLGFAFDISAAQIYEFMIRVDSPTAPTCTYQTLSGGASSAYSGTNPFTVAVGADLTGDEFWATFTYECIDPI